MTSNVVFVCVLYLCVCLCVVYECLQVNRFKLGDYTRNTLIFSLYFYFSIFLNCGFLCFYVFFFLVFLIIFFFIVGLIVSCRSAISLHLAYSLIFCFCCFSSFLFFYQFPSFSPQVVGLCSECKCTCLCCTCVKEGGGFVCDMLVLCCS